MKRKRNRGVLVSGLPIAAMLAATAGCTRPTPSAKQEENVVSSPSEAGPTLVASVQPIRYETYQLRGAKSIRDLERLLGAQGFELVLKINRIDRKHLPESGVLIIPSASSDLADPLRHAPFPAELERVQSIPKLILVSRRVQAFGAYERGRLVRWGPTSTGKQFTPTPAGLYHTNWKKREAVSTVDASWKLPWCFNLDSREGLAFHQFDLPGRPASHGCVRLSEDDAKWIYAWADQWVLSKSGAVLANGTPVVVFGEYAFGVVAPWKRLEKDPKAATLDLIEIAAPLAGYFPSIEKSLRSREVLLASLRPVTVLDSTR